MIDLSIIIVSFNTKKLTIDCVESIIKNTENLKYEIIVVDNASSDGTVDELESVFAKQNLQVIKNKENVGFGKANNQGIKLAKGKYILFLNSDTLVKENLLKEMVEWLDKEKYIGIATCALFNPDGSFQGTGGYFPTLLRVFSWMTIQDLPLVDSLIKPFHPMKEKSFSKNDHFYNKKKELDWVTGAFFLVKREVVETVGFFDEDYFMYTEETDYCFRAKKKGWKIVYNPKWNIAHYGGASGKAWSGVLREFEGVKLFYKKHYPAWQYPILRALLKVGALGRIVLFGLLQGREAAKAYAKALMAV